MITFFSTAKPFIGHTGVIQRNALASWKRAVPGGEVILFGDEEGAAEIAAELGIRHVPEVKRAPEGPKLLKSFFDTAQQIAQHEVLCYANCDILFGPEFATAVSAVRNATKNFLMVGRRWDTDVRERIDFADAGWSQRINAQARETGRPLGGDWIDYFVFPRGFFLGKLPDLVIGRVHWDQWLVWRAKKDGIAVVDASDTITAVHQNHDYGYHPAGRKGVWLDELSQRNYELTGGRWHLCTIDDATHVLGPAGFRENPLRKLRRLQRLLHLSKETVWLSALNWTRPLRRVLGVGSNKAA